MVNGHNSLKYNEIIPPEPQEDEERCDCGRVAKWYCELWPWKYRSWHGCRRDYEFSDDIDPSNRD